jgi:hypothetical protein
MFCIESINAVTYYDADVLQPHLAGITVAWRNELNQLR